MTSDTYTGEIVVVASTEDATARAVRIRAGMVSLVRFKDDVITAHRLRDWQALGYDDWDAWLTGEFGEHRVKLPRDQRQEITAGMREAGMSTRAIGAALGVSHETVRQDEVAGVKNLTGASNDAPESTGAVPVTGRDGKTYTPPTRPPAPAPQAAPPVPEVDLDHEFWDVAADKLTENGTVARWDAERPYLVAVSGLRNSAADITGLNLDPADLGRNVPDDGLPCLPAITAAHQWLGAFLDASKESRP